MQQAKHYDVISMARAMNKDFAKKTKDLFDPEVQAVHEAIASGTLFSIKGGLEYSGKPSVCIYINTVINVYFLNWLIRNDAVLTVAIQLVLSLSAP